ncbi:citrate lyase holo-[acyl-carrier protein] synthase [Lonsdalea iberica]|uniref:Apo-citrate lyase phosphoribosyl-dephospho-CoA transferase n=1 Tax=Lonsdalea iberica TaxID=1082703 RepID=A0A1X3S002_9GAMM|nr:citrate lyase holo-[acyl-carrier protein] synthase [Lonsdalea iberica]OSN07632.1 apo-citrate lyase phosphoribosyl-dephospho-CoA transferase [Lonsdalea iberica]
MNNVTAPSPATVTLERLLAAKERRAARQQALLARHHAPLVSLTLVTPGPIKDSPLYRRAMEEAVAAFDALSRQQGWQVAEHQLHWLETGAEGFWVVGGDALAIKRATVILEDTHPLGRLWDFDVFCPQSGALNRAGLDRAGRRCLLCDEPAHACARSRRHPLSDVLTRIEERLNAYFSSR